MSGSSSRVPPLLAGHDPEPMSFPAGTFDRAVDVWSWASALPRLVLATRTSFARFLASAFHLRWGDVACPPTALYPLPVPKPGCFDVGSGPEGGLRSSSRKRRALLLDRAVHIVAMSLNFLHSNFRFVPEALLQRRPSPCQLQVLARMRDMLRASSRSVGQPSCAPLCFGRRGVHLVARLSLLDSRGLGASPYAGKPLPQRVGHFAGGPSALPPYRDSDFFLLSFLRLAIMSGPLSPAGSLESFVFAIPPPLSCFSTFCPEVAFVSSLASSLSVLALLSFASVSALTPALRLGVPCALAKLWGSACAFLRACRLLCAWTSLSSALHSLGSGLRLWFSCSLLPWLRLSLLLSASSLLLRALLESLPTLLVQAFGVVLFNLLLRPLVSRERLG